AELLAPDGLFDHRQRQLAGDDRDPARARVLLDPGLGPPAKVRVGHLAQGVARVGRPFHLDTGHRLFFLDPAFLSGDRLDRLLRDDLELVGAGATDRARDDRVRAFDRVAADGADG